MGHTNLSARAHYATRLCGVHAQPHAATLRAQLALARAAAPAGAQHELVFRIDGGTLSMRMRFGGTLPAWAQRAEREVMDAHGAAAAEALAAGGVPLPALTLDRHRELARCGLVRMGAVHLLQRAADMACELARAVQPPPPAAGAPPPEPVPFFCFVVVAEGKRFTELAPAGGAAAPPEEEAPILGRQPGALVREMFAEAARLLRGYGEDAQSGAGETYARPALAALAALPHVTLCLTGVAGEGEVGALSPLSHDAGACAVAVRSGACLPPGTRLFGAPAVGAAAAAAGGPAGAPPPPVPALVTTHVALSHDADALVMANSQASAPHRRGSNEVPHVMLSVGGLSGSRVSRVLTPEHTAAAVFGDRIGSDRIEIDSRGLGPGGCRTHIRRTPPSPRATTARHCARARTPRVSRRCAPTQQTTGSAYPARFRAPRRSAPSGMSQAAAEAHAAALRVVAEVRENAQLPPY